MESITVRSAGASDMDALAALEQRVWSRRRGTPILTREELQEWYEEGSPYFLVAETDAGVCGYYFGRQIAFSPLQAEEFLSPAQATGRGYSAHAHVPGEDSVYGISVAAESPGAGMRLQDEFYRLLEVMGIQYFVGFTRLSTLDRYCKRIERANGGALPYPEEAVALWYVYDSARLLDMQAWPSTPPCPPLALPPLSRPDPVLAFHVRGTAFRLLGLLPNYMPDAASRNYGACIASSAPHR